MKLSLEITQPHGFAASSPSHIFGLVCPVNKDYSKEEKSILNELAQDSFMGRFAYDKANLDTIQIMLDIDPNDFASLTTKGFKIEPGMCFADEYVLQFRFEYTRESFMKFLELMSPYVTWSHFKYDSAKKEIATFLKKEMV